jgi:hypothetical protein
MVLSLIQFQFIAQPIWLNYFQGTKIYDQLDDLRTSSFLFVHINDRFIELAFDSYDDAVFAFYHSPVFEYEAASFFDDNQPFSYDVMVLQVNNQDSIFETKDVNGESIVSEKIDTVDNDRINFWTQKYFDAITTFNRSSDYQQFLATILQLTILVFTINLFIMNLMVLIIGYYLFPQFHSLGRKINKIILFHQDRPVALNRYITRSMVVDILIVYCSLLFFLIPLMITFAMVASHPKKSFLHDRMFQTQSVEEIDVLLFKNS